MGRRWGKTVMGGAISLGAASQGARVAWIVPIFRNGRALWRWVSAAAAPLALAGLADVSKTERTIEFANGGSLGIYSADNPDGIRGEAFHIAVLDEAARISEEAWTDVIQPTLADHDGDAILISTPKGMNWFYTEWLAGRDKMNHEMASWQAPTNANPSPQIRAAFEKARHRVAEHTFRQEWLAEFISDGSFFQRVDEACTVDKPDNPEKHNGHTILAGLDWAMMEDWTVLTLGCRQCNRVVDWDRFNRIDYTYQRERVADRLKRWRARVLPERNSIGLPNIEVLRQMGVSVLVGPDGGLGYNTTAANKPELIQRLASGLEHDGFRAPREYADELRSYEVEITASGHSKFGAPEGRHDDRVMSLALCWWAMTQINGVILFGAD